MPSKNEHNKFCGSKGIPFEVCEFVNSLIDEPQIYLPNILKTEGLKKFLGDRLGSGWEELVYAIFLRLEEVSHAKLHGVWKGDVQLTQKYRRLCEEIADYFYGEHGRMAVKLHFDLDTPEHVEHELSLYLLQGVEDSSYIPSERRYLPNSAILRKAIGKKDIYTILRLIQTSKDKDRVRKLIQKSHASFLEKRLRS